MKKLSLLFLFVLGSIVSYGESSECRYLREQREGHIAMARYYLDASVTLAALGDYYGSTQAMVWANDEMESASLYESAMLDAGCTCTC